MRKAPGWTFRGFAVIVALLATLQPMLGSFAFFRRGDSMNYETVHLVVGGILYNIVILLVLLAPFTLSRRRWTLFVISLMQYGLVHLQLRLGLGSNEDVRLLAYHIPLGVLIFAVSYLTAFLSFGPDRDTIRTALTSPSNSMPSFDRT